MDKMGEEYAIARQKSYHSQEMSKVILARLMLAQGEIPVSRAEISARASKDYEQHIIETAEAIRNEQAIKNKLEVAKAKFEGNRSLCSYEKRTQDLTE